MPRGASPKRERQYQKLVGKFKQEGRYKRREAEVAARIVNKQRAEHGETPEAKPHGRRHTPAEPSLPIAGYDELTVDQAAKQLKKLSREALTRVRTYEQQHRNRKTLLEAVDRQLKGL
jgi:hypothetical protein